MFEGEPPLALEGDRITNMEPVTNKVWPGICFARNRVARERPCVAPDTPRVVAEVLEPGAVMSEPGIVVDEEHLVSLTRGAIRRRIAQVDRNAATHVVAGTLRHIK